MAVGTTGVPDQRTVRFTGTDSSGNRVFREVPTTDSSLLDLVIASGEDAGSEATASGR